MYTIILSGGIGSRLWPLSNKDNPKQFFKLQNDRTLLQEAFIQAIEVKSKGIINVTNKNYFFKTKQEWNKLKVRDKQAELDIYYILETQSIGTSAAIALATLFAQKKYGDQELLLILPSDHVISNKKVFIDSVLSAQTMAHKGKIVTLGIRPDSPETGYGYIKMRDNKVEKFIEKPKLNQAHKYIKSKQYLWNSGILCFQVKTMIAEMNKYCPDILNAAMQIIESEAKFEESNMVNIPDDLLANIRKDSIDYSIMEKSDKISVVACREDIGWSDVGNWSRFTKNMQEQSAENAHYITENTKNCHIISNKKRLIATLGIENLVIVDSEEALLIVNKNSSEGIRNIYRKSLDYVSNISKDYKFCAKDWGNYRIIDQGNGFKIKRLEIHPGKSLSLQSHEFRSEHWVVIAGKANVIKDNKEFLLNINESTYIPNKTIHKVSNNSLTENLIIIEVQTGSYLEEDDIKRFEENILYRKTS